MAEYIEREAIQKIVYDIKENKEIPKNYGTLLDIIRLIRNLPTADVAEVKRGEWAAYPDEYEICATEFVCSCCKQSFASSELTDEQFFDMMKYCPNCGADMRGDKR